MTTFIAVRHGFSEYNKSRRFSGQLDIPLTDEGRAQAALACAYILENHHFDAICSSDLSRAVDTVQALSDATGLPIIKLSSLREIFIGDWQGRFFDELRTTDAELYATYRANPDTFTFPNGESMKQVDTRVMTALDCIAAHHDGDTVVLGTHGGFTRTILALALGASRKDVPNVSNCSTTVFTYDHGKITLLLTGYDAYITDIPAKTPDY